MRRFLVPVLLVLLCAACKKSEEGGTPGWSAVTYGPNLLSLYNPMVPAEQAYFIHTDSTDTLMTQGGIRFIVQDHSFLAYNNVPVTGWVKVKIHEYFRNSDLLSGGIGTATADGRLLVTGGAFNITIVDSAQREVRLVKMIDVSIPDRGHFHADHRLFVQRYINPLVPSGVTDPNVVNWGLDSTAWKQAQHGGGSFYDFSIYQLNWWNLDRFADQGQGMTGLSVRLPDGFGNTNSVVVVLTPENGLVRLYGEMATHTFTTGSYKVPVGMPAKLLAIAKQQSQYSYSLQDITIAAGQPLKVDSLRAISESDLQAVIQHSLN